MRGPCDGLGGPFGLLAIALFSLGACIPPPPAGPSREPPLVVPLAGTEPDLSETADLDALAGWIGEARLIGLGERVHGTHELHRLAHRILRYMAEEGEVTVFALEIDQAHGFLLDDFVQGRRDDLETVLEQRWWASEVFYDRALRDLLLWMRRHNASAPEPIRFAGFDLKQPRLAFELLDRELGEKDPRWREDAPRLYESLAQLGGFGGFPNVAGFRSTLTVELPAGRSAARSFRLSLQVREEGRTFGNVEVQVQAGTAVPRLSLEPGDRPIARWSAVELSGEAPPGLSALAVTLSHRGNGSVWFDGLSLTLDGERVPLEKGLADLRPQPLPAPRLQVMDHTGEPDAIVTSGGGSSLRVRCHPRVDEARAAAAELEALVAGTVDSLPELPPSRAVLLRQLARLIVQAVEWRTLAEPNRDVFLAENLTWLADRAHPGTRVLALAHTSHTERLPNRMGGLLAAARGDGYGTISMLALAGEYRNFGSLRTLRADSPLEPFPLSPSRARSDTLFLEGLAPGDLLLALGESLTALEPQTPGIDPVTAADVAILVRNVSALRPLPVLQK